MAAAVLAVLPVPAGAEPGPAVPPGGSASPLGTVTLITGDRVTVRALPVLDIRYDQQRGTAAGVSGFVTAAHQDGATRRPIRQLTVDASFDDGVSWQPVRVVAAGAKRKLDLKDRWARPSARRPGPPLST